MKLLLVAMTGIGFTLGVVLGLLLHLPTDSLPAEHGGGSARHRRNMDQTVDIHFPKGPASALGGHSSDVYDVIASPLGLSSGGEKGRNVKAGFDPRMNATGVNSNKMDNVLSGAGIEAVKHNEGRQQDRRLSEDVKTQSHGEQSNPAFDGESSQKHRQETNRFNEPHSGVPGESLGRGAPNDDQDRGVGPHVASSGHTQSPEDESYLESLVRGVLWTDKLEQSCPRAFKSSDVESWRKKAEAQDVVKMEEGCGRMQNRLLTFRDASRSCARYRLNADQIQGEIFSYYLAKLLSIPNLPPTTLAMVDSVDRKWRSIHLDLSLAQWADSKVVVLTQYIDGLEPAFIPQNFREEHRQLHPILAHLGTKTRVQLCELVQWSDLIVLDYLTANLDRVINNMFNRQWNDQIMESPAHNLEKFKNGHLVFLDNESGLFHGFRLLDKYESLHRSLLDSLCIFRPSTADAIKRLAKSATVGTELRALLQQHEPLYRHVANLPHKNVKILQRRIEQVNEQISKCEKMFNR